MKANFSIVLVAVLFALVLAAPAAAVPSGEKIVIADDTVILCPSNAVGPIMVEVVADGTATVQFRSTSRANRLWPDTNVGDSDAVFNLRDGIPRPFVVSGEKIDQVDVTLGTATEVIVTWTFGN